MAVCALRIGQSFIYLSVTIHMFQDKKVLMGMTGINHRYTCNSI